jgi:gamma-glutamyltranspeptidase/glutathione hydrolase
LILGFAALLVAWQAPLFAQTQADPERAAPSTQAGAARQVPRVVARHGMVVTAHPLATAAGLEILRKGGNAVDALIAASFVLNVVEPQSSGIGGGGFILIWNAKERQAVTIDGREEAPAAATPQWMLGPDGKSVPFPERITGGKAVAVPGLVKALDKASELYGRLPFAELVQPALVLAKNGIEVTPRMAAALVEHRERLSRFPATRRIFFDEAGEPLKAGAPLKQADLWASFLVIAANGAAGFYRGPIADAVVAAVNHAPVRPGAFSDADLLTYDAPLREPVRGNYRGHELIGMGPPSSGGPTLIEMLNLLEAREVWKLAPASPQWAHTFAQAARLAYADREAYLADTDWVQTPLAGLLDKAYARGRAGELDWEAPLSPVQPGRPPGASKTAAAGDVYDESLSTTHLVAIDHEGNIAAATNTIEQAFGSGMVVPGWGFFLNNEMTDFSAQPDDADRRPLANRVEGGKQPRRGALDNAASLGGKRPRSSMAPTLVLQDGKPLLVIGTPGGPRIIQFVAETVLRVIDQQMALQDAIEAPHLTHLGGTTTIEPALADPAYTNALQALGHKVQTGEQASGLHGIWIDPATGDLHSGVDPRREGSAAGF